MSQVTIVGAGLAGSLLAINLAKRGMKIDVYEARGDMRKETTAAGRSINLALSDRGIAALREVGMDEYMLAEAVPMYGRMIHSPTGETKLLPYSGRKGEYINSVSRAGLNVALMNEAEKYDGVSFHFNERCLVVDPETGNAVIQNHGTGTTTVVHADTLIGTDGAGSNLRTSMSGTLANFQLSEVFLEHRYVELVIPPGLGGTFQLEKSALHIWPRHRFMMIALPNMDGSFTCTLFLAAKGPDSFESIFSPEWNDEEYWEGHNRAPLDANGMRLWRHPLQSSAEERLIDFFESNFPDALPLMPTLIEDFINHPIGNLGTVKCWPWNINGKSLLLGDSAHAVVPFYGQGMNCAFEDVRVLSSLIDEIGTDWTSVYEEYGRLRKINTDAIADMAEENFYEMRDATADPIFQRKRELETKLEQTYPDYFSKYSMVTFREDLPYSIAKQKGNAQDRLLMEICSNVSDNSEIELSDVIETVRKLDQ
ncbi:MAG TPA: NAD(P)/FAD-dependent oxidoreductase [Pyrinomonadaceae bacterium]|nr:NAD(P)/FAD-dependent oxidoreductase [Pyrinomonadaceae bacterium]